MSYVRGLVIGIVCGFIASLVLTLLASIFMPRSSYFEGLVFIFGTIAFFLVPVSVIIAAIVVFVGNKSKPR